MATRDIMVNIEPTHEAYVSCRHKAGGYYFTQRGRKLLEAIYGTPIYEFVSYTNDGPAIIIPPERWIRFCIDFTSRGYEIKVRDQNKVNYYITAME